MEIIGKKTDKTDKTSNLTHFPIEGTNSNTCLICLRCLNQIHNQKTLLNSEPNGCDTSKSGLVFYKSTNLFSNFISSDTHSLGWFFKHLSNRDINSSGCFGLSKFSPSFCNQNNNNPGLKVFFSQRFFLLHDSQDNISQSKVGITTTIVLSKITSFCSVESVPHTNCALGKNNSLEPLKIRMEVSL